MARENGPLELIGVQSLLELERKFFESENGKDKPDISRRKILSSALVATASTLAVGSAWWLTKLKWRSRPVSIAYIQKGDLSYMRDMFQGFESQIRQLLPQVDVQVFQLDSKLPQSVLDRHQRNAFDFFVTAGTQATSEMKTALGRKFGEVPFIFLGVSFPLEMHLVKDLRNRKEERQVCGVQYGPGPESLVKELCHLLPKEKKFIFVYDDKALQDVIFAEHLRRCPEFKNNRVLIVKSEAKLSLDDLRDPDVIYFGWYELEDLFDEAGVNKDLAKRKVVTSTSKNVKDDLSFLSIAPNDKDIGVFGANIVSEHFLNGVALETREVTIPRNLYWINTSVASAKSIIFSPDAKSLAEKIFPE